VAAYGGVEVGVQHLVLAGGQHQMHPCRRVFNDRYRDAFRDLHAGTPEVPTGSASSCLRKAGSLMAWPMTRDRGSGEGDIGVMVL